ncbi:Type I restriction-modification system methyltransferase subunit [Nocardia otitidiscaviarum]|uniref:Type I restriction-modification system methyltransferase subunit n=1 Tax=Nocardia otitidiscaviarum TaxID=1823 RepID=A0A379JGD5_9NOCA|nr:N-6 DNA methylase [Nocardia otitidiscaviarum]SUD47426.1 Type I restriction-modification system methyltransferase subunit [Nocardia otitidiscaviarum]
MPGSAHQADLLTLVQVAALSDVERSTPSNWRRRHEDAPKPVAREGARNRYRLSDWQAWLDTREIPADQLAPDEPAGTTYGDRFRYNLTAAQDVSQPRDTTLAPAEIRARIARLEQHRLRLRGYGVPDHQFYEAAMLIAYTWACAPDQWDRIHVANHVRRIEPHRYVDIMARHIDHALRRHNLPTGAKAALAAIGKGRFDELTTLVGLCSELGVRGFDLLFERMAQVAVGNSSDYITPTALANLMATLATQDRAPGTVLDPYLRGGELLHAVTTRAAEGSQPIARGVGVSTGMVRVAGMRLAVHGRAAHLRTGDTVPWTHPTADHADTIVTNPNFGQRSPRNPAWDTTMWPFGEPPAHNDNFAWLQYAVTRLGPNGRAVVLLPELTVASNDAHERQIRANLVDRGAVAALISLPADIFPVASVPVIMWILEPPRPKGNRRVLLIDARTMRRRDPGAPHGTLIDIDHIAQAFAARDALHTGELRSLPHGGNAVAVDAERIRDADFRLHPGDFVRQALERRHSQEGEVVDPALGTFDRTRRALDRLLAAADAGAAVISTREWVARTLSAASAHRAEARLTDVCEITAGPSHSRLQEIEFLDQHGVEMVMPKNLRGQRIILDDAPRLSDRDADTLSRFRLLPDDILIVRTGAITEPAIVRPNQEGRVFNTNLLRIRIRNQDELDPWYLLAVLSAPNTMSRLREVAHRKRIPSLSAPELGSVALPMPPIIEQRTLGTVARALNVQLAALRAAADAAEEFRDVAVDRLVTGTLEIR